MFKKNFGILVVLLLLVTCITGCGGKTSDEKNTNGESIKKQQVTYYEDYNKLPELKNVTKYKSESSSKTLTGSNEGRVTIKYVINDGDSSKEIVDNYWEEQAVRNSYSF